MRTTARGSERGVTLIEILLALIVMVLGMVGILALFPGAMQQASESMEDTQAAILGESVAHALVTALRNVQIDPAGGTRKAVLVHDLYASDPAASGNGERGRYEFALPPGDPTGVLPANPWHHYPSAPKPPAADPGAPLDPATWDAEQDPRVFKLGGDGWLKATTDNVKDNYDPTDAWSQFGFSFNVQKVRTLDYLIGKPKATRPGEPAQRYEASEVDDLQKLYEFKIVVFRIATQGATFGGGTAVGGGGGQDVRKAVAVITKRIAVR
jgi:type II secretory pathway pseudopilin PulG